MVRKKFEDAFGRELNVKGKKVPMNAITTKLILYVIAYLLIIFNLAVFLIAMNMFAPQLMQEEPVGLSVFGLSFDNTEIVLFELKENNDTVKIPAITGMVVEENNPGKMGCKPTSISNSIIPILPHIYNSLLVLLTLMAVLTMIFSYFTKRVISKTASNIISQLMLLSITVLAYYQIKTGVTPIGQYMYLVFIVAFISGMYLLKQNYPWKQKGITPNLNRLIQKRK